MKGMQVHLYSIGPHLPCESDSHVIRSAASALDILLGKATQLEYSEDPFENLLQF